MPECPLCNSAAHSYTERNGHRIYKCDRCALMFVHPIPDPSAVYSADYFAGASQGHGYVSYDEDKQPMVPTFEKYMREIVRLAPRKGKLLDVGAATGFFLSIAKRFGFDVEGIEISDYAAAEGRKKGIQVQTGTLADVDPSKRYNVITMLDVIEHVPDPAAELRRARALLERDGILVINTPDAGSLYARTMGPRWHLIVPPEHLYYFNRANLSDLLRRSGFEVVLVGSVGKRFTIPYIFKTLYMWQRLPIWKRLATLTDRPGLRRMGIPINLRDNMFLIARAQ